MGRLVAPLVEVNVSPTSNDMPLRYFNLSIELRISLKLDQDRIRRSICNDYLFDLIFRRNCYSEQLYKASVCSSYLKTVLTDIPKDSVHSLAVTQLNLPFSNPQRFTFSSHCAAPSRAHSQVGLRFTQTSAQGLIPSSSKASLPSIAPLQTTFFWGSNGHSTHR